MTCGILVVILAGGGFLVARAQSHQGTNGVPARVVPDETDLKNELVSVSQRLLVMDERMTGLTEELRGGLKNMNAYIIGFVGLLAVVVGILYHSISKGLERAEKSIEEARNQAAEVLKATEEQIVSEINSTAERINQTYEEPERLKNEIVGLIVRKFGDPVALKRAALGEIIELFVNEGIIDTDCARRMRRSVDKLHV